MSPDLVAAIARTTRQIADTLDIPHDRPVRAASRTI